MDRLSFIKSVIKEASGIAKSNFGRVKGVVKGADNNQVLTETDLAIGQLLVSAIRKEFPQHNVIDEESGAIDNKSAFTWAIDPIDGTSNFAAGLPMYGIMVGLLEDGRPVSGGVALPFFDEIYWAEKGKGAFCNGEKIAVTGEKNLINCLGAYFLDGHPEDREATYRECRLLADFALSIRNHRSSNSCFDIMMLARGKYGAWLNRTSKIWDNAAPQIIIEEAGGIYTDFVGNAVDYSDPLSKLGKNFTVCAAPPQLHPQLQQLVKKHGYSD